MSHLYDTLLYGFKLAYHTIYLERQRVRQDDISAHNDSFRKPRSYINTLREGDPNGIYRLKRQETSYPKPPLLPSPLDRRYRPCLPHSRWMDVIPERSMTTVYAPHGDRTRRQLTCCGPGLGSLPWESIETWMWFLEQLKDAYPTLNQRGRSLITDRDKGIAHAAETVFHLINHLHCIQHIK